VLVLGAHVRGEQPFGPPRGRSPRLSGARARGGRERPSTTGRDAAFNVGGHPNELTRTVDVALQRRLQSSGTSRPMRRMSRNALPAWTGPGCAL
jgi:hypothetical protein